MPRASATDELTRILCVEDEADIRTIIELALSGLGGFEVRCCATGLDAITEAQTFGPQLILLDVMMPGMDGVTTFGRLRAEASTAQVPVIFLTARTQPGEIEHYRSLGALDVITKPFDPLLLAEQVRRIWGSRGGR